MSKFRNLFICITPLQIVIAKRIIEEKQLKEVGFIIVFYNENPKYRFYIDRLKTENYITLEYKVNSQSKLGRLIDVFKLKLFLKQKKLTAENIYLASIENALIHVILSNLNPKTLFTFDDGLANLDYCGQYYTNRENKIQKLVKKVLNISWHQNRIKNNSICHFSIYPNHKNIIPTVEFISLINDIQFNNTSNSYPISIFLGQPFNEIIAFDVKKLNPLSNTFKIDIYFPHPRESLDFSSLFDTKIQSTELIFEDYIISLINQNLNIKIVTIISTAALNVIHIPNVSVIALYDEALLARYNHLYALLSNSGAQLVKLPENPL